jgi:hypothetical protein
MKKSVIVTLATALMCSTAPALATTWLEPCQGLSFLESAALPANAEGPDLVSVPANKMGCARGVSLRVDATTTLWRCQVELAEGAEFKEGQPEYGFLIHRANQPLQEMPDELMAGAYRNFEVVKVDLDADGSRENILAAWNGQSNGIGTHNWTIYAFDANWNLIKRFDNVSDWGRSNLVKTPAQRRGCDIAITSFQDAPAISGRARGLVFRATVFSAQPKSAVSRTPDIRLDVADDRPVIERRYTRAFERQRTTWFSRGNWQWRGNVADWFNNPATKAK